MVTAAALQLLPQRYPECARVQDARGNAGRHLAGKLKGLAPLDRMTLHLLSGSEIVYLIILSILLLIKVVINRVHCFGAYARRSFNFYTIYSWSWRYRGRLDGGLVVF